MPLATLDRTPPPFFRQGTSAHTKLLLSAALALFLMAADARFTLTQPVRAAFATALLPVIELLNLPVQAWHSVGDYTRGLHHALSDAQTMRAQLAEQAERAARGADLLTENQRLRALLDLRPGLMVKSRAAEVLYEAPDPYSRKLFIDRGERDGIIAGSPVINNGGVLGQVTRVYPLSAEVTLLVDKKAAIPVLNQRTQHRSAAYGGPSERGMELRFMTGNDDVQAGDVLITSGVDGIYPPGLKVATVASVDRRADSAFARVSLLPSAQPDGVRHVLVLEPVRQQQADRPPPAEEEPAASPAPRARRGRR